jgi:hypothetical protein
MTNPEPFTWFRGPSVTKLIKDLTAASLPRLEVYQKGDKMTFKVVDETDGKVHDPINDSHVCPPICP